jgi:hypothetical protein
VTRPDPPTLPHIGDIIEAKEPDYRYGTGVLRLRVLWVGSPADGWVEVSGQDLRPDLTAVFEGEVPRRAWVRVDRVRMRYRAGAR